MKKERHSGCLLEFFASIVDIDFNDLEDDKDYYFLYTENGQYVRKSKNIKALPLIDISALNPEQKKEIEQEHVRNNMSFLTSSTSLGKEMGIGVRLYFDFFKFLIIMNFFLAIIQSFNYFMGVFYKRSIYDSFPTILYSSNFQPFHRLIWYITNSFSLIFTMVVPFIYLILLKLRNIKFPENQKLKLKVLRSRKDVADLVREPDMGEDSITQNLKEHKRYYLVILKRLISYGLLVFILLIQAGISYGITYAQFFYYEALKGDQSPQGQAIVSVGSILIGLAITIASFLYGQIATSLNQWECYGTWTMYRLAYSLKFIIFRTSQLVIVNIVKAQTINDACPIYAFGSQYFSMLLTDMTVGNLLQIVTPIIMYNLYKCCSKTHHSNESLRSEFDISDEYIGLLYRQFVLYNAMVSFPLAPVVVFVAGIIEFFVDKFKVTQITQRPKQVLSSMNTQLLLITAMISLTIIALLNVGGGPIYLLTGEYFFCNNYKPLGYNVTLQYCKTKCQIFYGFLNETIIGNGTVNPVPIYY